MWSWSHLFCNVLIIKEIFAWIYALSYLCPCTADSMHMLHISNTTRHATPRHARHDTTLFANVPRGTCTTLRDSWMLDAARLHTPICKACLICKAPRMLNGQGGGYLDSEIFLPPTIYISYAKIFLLFKKIPWQPIFLASPPCFARDATSVLGVQYLCSARDSIYAIGVFDIQSVSYSISVLYIYCAVSDIFVQRAVTSVPSVPSVTSVYLMFNLLATVSVSYGLTARPDT